MNAIEILKQKYADVERINYMEKNFHMDKIILVFLEHVSESEDAEVLELLGFKYGYLEPNYELAHHYFKRAIEMKRVFAFGKSTLSKQLCEHYKAQGLKCKYFPEHVNLEFLNLFISDMKNYAFAFQMYMLERRLEMIRQSEEFILRTNGVAILDRSLHGDYTFGLLHRLNGNMTDDEWKIYEQKVKSIYMIIRPKKVIYLDASI